MRLEDISINLVYKEHKQIKISENNVSTLLLLEK